MGTIMFEKNGFTTASVSPVWSNASLVQVENNIQYLVMILGCQVNETILGLGNIKK